MKNSNILNSLSYSKTILILLVVLNHSLIFWAGGWEFDLFECKELGPCVLLADWLKSFHIYALTFISGFVFAFIEIDRASGGYKSFKVLCRSKFLRLIVPYVFVALVWVIPSEVLFKGYDISKVFYYFILGEGPNQLWFLLMLFNVFILFWPVRKVTFKKPLLAIIYILGVYVCGLIGSNFFPNYFQIWTACQYVLFFYLGFIYYKWRDRFFGTINPIVWLVIDILLFLSYEFLQVSSTLFSAVHLINGIVLRIVGCVMAVELTNFMLPEKKTNDSIFHSVSNNSMGIYLFHQQVIYYLIYIFWFKLGWNPALCIFINFIVSVSIAYFITAMLMKTKLTRQLIGEKK